MKKSWKRIGAAIMAFAMAVSLVPPASAALVKAAGEEYEIYPNPHQITYQDGSWELGTTANLVCEDGIDEATQNRLKEVLDLKKIQGTKGTAEKSGSLNILVGIHDSGSYVDKYVDSHYQVDDSLFEKTDSYFLASSSNTLVVLGAHTDAAFYGLTTLYHIFKQTEGTAIRNFQIQDWADVTSRGFIEGYYGNPWSTQNRVDLMTWGGYYKLNSYFYAPKDDPKHNSNWKALYTDEEIEEKIKPLAEAGNASKCRFVYALHPYMYNAIRYSSDSAYQQDLAALQAKFEQVIKAGVRQIAILADDANSVGEANYTRTLNDMTEWLKKMQKTYPDLKLTLPFCPVEYMYNGSAYYSNFPENVQVVMTGGKVWGEVTDTFTTAFTNTVKRGPYMWINWPCTDNSKKHLIMGGYTTFLHPGVDPSKIQGIVLNPMQQSEPSKVAIFGNACYSWNIWETEDEANTAWENSFKYVDHNSAIETEASTALREISRHMINQAMDTRVTALQESLNIREEVTAFRNALAAGSVTAAQCDSLIKVFTELKGYAKTFSEKAGDTKLRDQMIYWLNCWEDTTTAAIAYLEAVKGGMSGNMNVLLQKYNEGRIAFAKSKTYGFNYVDHTEYAEVGVQHIVPLIKEMAEYVIGEVQYIVNPDAVQTKFITNRTDTPVGDKESVFDGMDSTSLSYRDPVWVYTGDYVGVMMSKAIPVDHIRFLMGTGKNHFEHAKLQYTTDGKDWKDLGNTQYTGVQGQYQEIVLEKADLPAGFEAMGIRLIATADNTLDCYLDIYEITINQGGQSQSPSGERVTGTVTVDGMSVRSGEMANILDGDNSTEIQLAKDPYSGDDRDKVPAGASITITFSGAKTLGTLKLVQGISAAADVFSKAEVQYTTDGSKWTKAGTLDGTAEQTVNFGGISGITAVKIVNNTATAGWLRISEIAIYEGSAAGPDDSYVYTNVSTDILADAEEGRVSLTSGSVTLNKDEYIGIKLKSIKDIEKITAGSYPDSLKLQISKNGIEWNEADKGDARYVRLINTGSQAVNYNLTSFVVEYKVIGEITVESDFSIGDAASDMRSTGTVGNVFDGDLSTYAAITGSQDAGKYIRFDMGRTINFKSLRYYIVETQKDYPRDVVFEVADSPEAASWTEVLSVKKEGFTNTSDTTTAKDMQDKGLTHDSQNPGYMYAEATNLNVSGRYLRVRVRSAYSHRWIGFNEIQINGGAYMSTEADRDVVSEAAEMPGMKPSNMLDGDITTSYLSSEENSSFTYYISEPAGVKSIRIIQFGETSRAAVTAEVYDQTSGKKDTVTLGTLSRTINEFNVPEGKLLLSVKAEWKDVKAEIAEIMLGTTAVEIPEEAEKTELQKAVDAAKKLKKSEYTAESWAPFKEALDEADVVLADVYATQDQVDAAVSNLKEKQKALVSSGSASDSVPYGDVKKGDWYYNYVKDVYAKKLMTGLKDDVFGPNQTLVRAQFATILYRMENKPKVSYSGKFGDVQPSQFYTEAVLWAAADNVRVVTGYSNGNFGPNDQITREQMALMMYRYAKYKGYDTKASADLTKYPDYALVSEYARTAMEWCVANGIISGQGTDVKMLNPQGQTSRAECATIISRYSNLDK